MGLWKNGLSKRAKVKEKLAQLTFVCSKSTKEILEKGVKYVHPGFCNIFFFNFKEKKPCTKSCGILVSFYEVVKLQSFEFDVSDVILANAQNILPGFLCIFFIASWRKIYVNIFIFSLSFWYFKT